MNSVVLIGRLVRDPELKALTSGTVITNFTLAADRPFSKEKQADFIPCICFGKTAENVANYLTKGRQAAVNGYMQTRTWEKDGVKHYATEVVANSVEFLGSRNGSEGSHPEAPTRESLGHEVSLDDDIPF